MLSEDELKKRLMEINHLKGFLYHNLQTAKYNEFFYTLKKIKNLLKKIKSKYNENLINEYTKKIDYLNGSFKANNFNPAIAKDFVDNLDTERLEREAKKRILQMDFPVADAMLIVCSKGRNQFSEQFKNYDDKKQVVERIMYLIRLAWEKIHLFAKNHTTLKQIDIVVAPSVEVLHYSKGLSSLRLNKGDRVYWHFEKMPLSELKSKYLNKIIEHQQIKNVHNQMIYVLFICEIVPAEIHGKYKTDFSRYGPWTEFSPIDIILGEQYGVAA